LRGGGTEIPIHLGEKIQQKKKKRIGEEKYESPMTPRRWGTKQGQMSRSRGARDVPFGGKNSLHKGL